MRTVARGIVLAAAVLVSTETAAGQEGPVLGFAVGPSHAVGGAFENRTGVLLEGGATTSEFGEGLRLGIRLSFDFRPMSGFDNCIVTPGSANLTCREKAPTFAGIGPEVHWRATRVVGFRLGGGVVGSGDREGSGTAIHVGMDLRRAIGRRSDALLVVRLQRATGVADQGVTTLSVGVGIQRRHGRAP